MLGAGVRELRSLVFWVNIAIMLSFRASLCGAEIFVVVLTAFVLVLSVRLIGSS